MKYYCKNCGSGLCEGDDTRRSDDYEVYCPMCEDENNNDVRMEPVPDYETPAQYEKRTGKTYPGDGLVWIKQIFSNFWEGTSLEGAKEISNRSWPNPIEYIVIADPPVPPPDDFVPEGI